jgi:hypothetical protein
MTGDDLIEILEVICVNSATGAKMLNCAYPTSYRAPTLDEVMEVLDAALDDIAEHRDLYNIRMNNYDSNKLVAFLAWHLKHRDSGFSTAPMFFGHLNFIDESKRGAPTLLEIPKLPEICENLDRFLLNGQKIAPYTFLKGIDLTYLHCCPILGK